MHISGKICSSSDKRILDKTCREIEASVGYTGPFMEIINHWNTEFQKAHDDVTGLLSDILGVGALTALKAVWDEAATRTLSVATVSYSDLPENLNEFIRDIFNATLLGIYTWCRSVSVDTAAFDVTAMKSSALDRMQRIQFALQKFCCYFVSHEYNTLVASFRNVQDYMPVDFFFDPEGNPFDLLGFRSRFKESRLATFYLSAFLVVKYPQVGDEDASFFDTFYKPRSSQEETFAMDDGTILPTIFYARRVAKDHLRQVCFDYYTSE